MKEILKFVFCFVVTMILISLLMPIIKFIGIILSLIIGVCLINMLMSWLSEKYHWNW